MKNDEYLDFEEAVEFLKTTPSTLYKWLQSGKIQGHKLGRQWRFLRDELELHMSGKSATIQHHKEILELAGLLAKRAANRGGLKMETSVFQISEQVIWDAYHSGSRLIHVEPSQGRFQIRYRNRNGLEKLASISEETFRSLDMVWRKESTATRDEDTRRMYLHRAESDALQVRYQKLETVTGPRVTLQLFQPFQDVMPLEKVVDGQESILKKLKSWISKSYGLIVVCGPTGSGKTTTLYSLINEIKTSGSAVFTLEKPVYMVVDGINQTEVHKNSDFEDLFDKVYNSDPDVICLGLGEINELNSLVYTKAYGAAASGHLVILQMNASSPEEAYKILKENASLDLDRILIGICHQKLTLSGNKLKPTYSFIEPEKK
jgi:general secretion pathway protein E